MRMHKMELGNFLTQDLFAGVHKKEKFATSFVEKMARDVEAEFQEKKASIDERKLIRAKKLLADIDYRITTSNHKLAIELIYRLVGILN